MFLGQLLVVFVGIAGNHHEAVEQQLAPTLDRSGITELVLADGDLTEVVHHTRASRDIVRKLHVDGVIAGEVVTTKTTRSFRVLMYDGDGTLSSDSATPFTGRVLAKTDLDVLAMNLKDAVDTIANKHKPKAAARRAPAVHAAPPHEENLPAFTAPAAPVASVDRDDGVASESPLVEKSAAPAQEGGIRVHAGLTLGIVGRSMSTDPNTIKSYSSTPVGTGGFDLGLDLGARGSITGTYEHTLVMHSLVAGDSIASSIGRWQVLAAYDLIHGAVWIAPILGIGGRSFAIDSTSNTRSPDTDYTYLVLGASIAKPIGSHVALRGTAALEPVLGGAQPLMTADASRLGFDLGVALEIRPTTHVFVRAAFDYQQFGWTWAMVGGATDGYPTGTLAAGAAF